MICDALALAARRRAWQSSMAVAVRNSSDCDRHPHKPKSFAAEAIQVEAAIEAARSTLATVDFADSMQRCTALVTDFERRHGSLDDDEAVISDEHGIVKRLAGKWRDLVIDASLQ